MNGHGFIAATSMKLDGKQTDRLLREIVYRSVFERLPQDVQHVAREFVEKQQAVVREADFTGRGDTHHACIVNGVAWRGVRKGRTRSNPAPLRSSPATMWILVVSIAP